MIYLKTEEEIELLRENNLLVSRTLAEVGRHIAPGVTTKELDTLAEDFARSSSCFSRIPGIPRFAVYFDQRRGGARYSVIQESSP